MLIFTHELYTPQHFDVMKAWYKERKFPAPNQKFLPGTGVMVSYQDIMVACGFLFLTDADTCSIGHLISDPKLDREIRQQAVNYTVGTLVRIGTEDGYGLITCCSNIEKLNKRFESLGFERVDENVTHFRRFLCPLSH